MKSFDLPLLESCVRAAAQHSSAQNPQRQQQRGLSISETVKLESRLPLLNLILRDTPTIYFSIKPKRIVHKKEKETTKLFNIIHAGNSLNDAEGESHPAIR